MDKDLFKEGCSALEKGEWEEAKDLLEKASVQSGTAEVFEKLAWACWWINDSNSYFDYRSKAYQLYLEKNDKRGASRNASWMGADYLEFKGELAVASGWFKRAESLLEGLEPSWELALIKILKARLIYMLEKDSEKSFKILNESLEIGRSLNASEVEMIAEALKGYILVVEGNISEGMPLLDDATVLAITNEKSDVQLTTITCCFLIDACERVRDYERAVQWCGKVKEICTRWRYKAMFANCRMKHAGVLIWKGDWTEAEDELQAASAELKELRPLQVNACIIRLGDLKRRQGKWDEAEALFDRVKSHSLKFLFTASLFYDKKEYEKACNCAERFLRQYQMKERMERVQGLELLIRIYLELRKIKEAKILLKELKETSELVNTLPLKAACLNAEGGFYSSEENYESAVKKLEDAVDIYDKISVPFDSARCRLLLAKSLIKIERFAQAEIELNTALNVLKNLGAEKDFAKAEYLLKNLHKNIKEITAANLIEFTGRELEVLRLISEGKNNEEIAQKLFLSVRTVEKHLTNIYSKMGISGKSARAYAASYAIKHNLIYT